MWWCNHTAGWCWLVFFCTGGVSAALKQSSSGQSVPISQPATEASGNFQVFKIHFDLYLLYLHHCCSISFTSYNTQRHIFKEIWIRKLIFEGNKNLPALSSCVLFLYFILGKKKMCFGTKSILMLPCTRARVNTVEQCICLLIRNQLWPSILKCEPWKPASLLTSLGTSLSFCPPSSPCISQRCAWSTRAETGQVHRSLESGQSQWRRAQGPHARPHLQGDCAPPTLDCHVLV